MTAQPGAQGRTRKQRVAPAEGPVPGLRLCSCHLEILILFEQGPHSLILSWVLTSGVGKRRPLTPAADLEPSPVQALAGWRASLHWPAVFLTGI